LASFFADKAVALLKEEQGNKIVGLESGRITTTELEKSCSTKKPLNLDILRLAKVLST
jgi:hypothetical protein